MLLHRDDESSFLEEEDSKKGLPRIMISDFGECQVLSEEEQLERTGATGTLEFMPPELLQRDSKGQYMPSHSLKADIWSLGVVLYFLCYSDIPYSQTDDVDLLKDEILGFTRVQLEFPPGHDDRVSGRLRELILRLLCTDPSQRPSVDDILLEYGNEREIDDIFSDPQDHRVLSARSVIEQSSGATESLSRPKVSDQNGNDLLRARRLSEERQMQLERWPHTGASSVLCMLLGLSLGYLLGKWI